MALLMLLTVRDLYFSRNCKDCTVIVIIVIVVVVVTMRFMSLFSRDSGNCTVVVVVAVTMKLLGQGHYFQEIAETVHYCCYL